MIKRLFATAMAALAITVGASAQFGILNHVGVDLSVSTTGIGIELSTPVTDFLQVRAGASFIPKVTFKTNVDGTIELSSNGITKNEPFDLDLNGNVARTQGDVIVNVYPIGRVCSLFIAGGVYFGGDQIIKLDGHSDRVAQLYQEDAIKNGWVELGDYKIDFDRQGNIQGAIMTKKVRPYVGLGYGRPCPGKRLGFMFEAGVQFMGKMKVCQGADLTPVDISNLNNDNDWQKVLDKVSVYPVIKFTLTGRIF